MKRWIMEDFFKRVNFSFEWKTKAIVFQEYLLFSISMWWWSLYKCLSLWTHNNNNLGTTTILFLIWLSKPFFESAAREALYFFLFFSSVLSNQLSFLGGSFWSVIFFNSLSNLRILHDFVILSIMTALLIRLTPL